MRSSFAIILAALLLSACAATPKQPIVQTRTIVISPPEALMVCQRVPMPAPEVVITNEVVADLLVRQHRALNKCVINMDAIRRYVAETQNQNIPSP